MAGEQSEVFNLLADYFDDLSTLEGTWSDEVQDYVIGRRDLQDLASRYAGRVEAALARQSPAQDGEGSCHG